jgi:heme-degrading monooxygenase HmoA
MIARHWKGIAKPELADAYKEHLIKETFPTLKTLNGFVDSFILNRVVTKGIEFLVITQWDSISSIKAFSGEDAEIAVVPTVVQEMMVEFDRRAVHYDVVAEFR